MRIGYGYDVHRLQEGLPLILGGVRIDHPYGLVGHSDADVLLHAIMDALLGAAALGDIGSHFPDSDQKFKGADSLKLLAATCHIIKEAGFKIVNIDSTIIAEKPRMKPFIGQMCENIAKVCQIDLDRVNVKATTEEGLGFTGKGLGISAHAVCLLD